MSNDRTRSEPSGACLLVYVPFATLSGQTTCNHRCTKCESLLELLGLIHIINTTHLALCQALSFEYHDPSPYEAESSSF